MAYSYDLTGLEELTKDLPTFESLAEGLRKFVANDDNAEVRTREGVSNDDTSLRRQK